MNQISKLIKLCCIRAKNPKLDIKSTFVRNGRTYCVVKDENGVVKIKIL